MLFSFCIFGGSALLRSQGKKGNINPFVFSPPTYVWVCVLEPTYDMLLARDEVAFVINTFIVLTHMQQENEFVYHFFLNTIPL
jgi:hypothetical protein